MESVRETGRLPVNPSVQTWRRSSSGERKEDLLTGGKNHIHMYLDSRSGIGIPGGQRGHLGVVWNRDMTR